MTKKSYRSIKDLLANEALYPTASVVKYGDKFYPSINRAAKNEGVSKVHIKNFCKVYTRTELKQIAVSLICF